MNRLCVKRSAGVTIAMMLLAASTTIAHPPEMHGEQSEFKPWSHQEEIRFLEAMMNRHALAAQVGKLARQRGTHTKLRSWGDTLASTHAAEAKRIQGMLRSGYQITRAPVNAAGASTLAKLKGAEFEQELLNLVIRELGAGLGEARECQQMAMKDDLQRACASWATSQQREVVTAGGWLCEWYQKCE
jgi:uncharacterized protein (DUF305 family)